MTPRRLMAAIALAAASAHAQSFTSDSTITFSLHWSDHGGNNNGVLEPGESALLSLDVSFTNQNTIAMFSPPFDTFGSGTIRGFASGFIDLHGTGGAAGTWDVDYGHGYGVSPDWGLPEPTGNGTPRNGGIDLVNIQMGQFSPTPSSINTTNPIICIWAGTWTPDAYSPRTVTIGSMGAAAAGAVVSGVVLRLSPTTIANMFLHPSNLVFSTATIPIVPAPAAVLWISAAFFAPSRRTRPARDELKVSSCPIYR